MLTIQQFSKYVHDSWSEASSYSPQLWTIDSPGVGQALPTALLFADFFGGHIVLGHVDEIPHVWNSIPGIGEFDLTLTDLPEMYGAKQAFDSLIAEELYAIEPTVVENVRALRNGVIALARAHTV